MAHENWRNDAPLVSTSVSKNVSLKTHRNRVLNRCRDFGKQYYSYRKVTGYGRTGEVRKRQWDGNTMTFVRMALGTNTKIHKLM